MSHNTLNSSSHNICVVIPLYNSQDHIEKVIKNIPKYISSIIVVDDCSTDNSYKYARNVCDNRTHIIRHLQNQGVGGAVLSGYQKAIQLGAEIIVKMDADGDLPPQT